MGGARGKRRRRVGLCWVGSVLVGDCRSRGGVRKKRLPGWMRWKLLHTASRRSHWSRAGITEDLSWHDHVTASAKSTLRLARSRQVPRRNRYLPAQGIKCTGAKRPPQRLTAATRPLGRSRRLLSAGAARRKRCSTACEGQCPRRCKIGSISLGN